MALGRRRRTTGARSDGSRIVADVASMEREGKAENDAAPEQATESPAPRDGAGPGDPLGVCCSGGGIRSAAFTLGALQVLDRTGHLRRARYLSAVSGGSYMASAYALANRYSDPDLLREQPAYAPGSPEERWLRNRCSYLAAGVAGKARLVSSVLVGVLVNVVVLGLVLYTAMRPLGWAYARWQESLRLPEGCGSARRGDPACYPTAELTHIRPFVGFVVATVTLALVLALAARMFYPPWRRRRLCNRLAVGLLATAAVVAVVTLVLPGLVVLTRNVLGGRHALEPVSIGAEAVSAEGKSGNSLVLGSTVGLLAVFGAAASQIAAHLRGVLAVGKTAAAGARWFTKLGRTTRKLLVDLVGGLIGPLAVLAVSLLIINGAATHRSPTDAEWVVWGAVVVVTLLVVRFTDITSSSMHPFYKRRLSSAFAVARTKGPDGEARAAEIDYQTVLSLSRLRDERSEKGPVPDFPELVVCAAANVTDPGATPPGSAVVSFVFTPSTVSIEAGDGHDGNVMDMATYERRIGKRRRMDVTVPAAVAMSGAAISPAMGKMTKAPLRFLLALSNVRLGVWLPNPRNLPIGCDRDGGQTVVDQIAPANPRPHLLLREVLGIHRLSSRYVYVSDGGHYENLGLLELVRRGCRTIVCFDAAGGSPTSFTTLGEAIALVRAELNVEIDVNPTMIRPAEEGRLATTCCAVGAIHYPDGSAGTLVYVKAAVIDAAPWDVRAFAEKDPVFPSHPTASQLYTGERFEAYRALGAKAGEQAATALGSLAATVPDVVPAEH